MRVPSILNEWLALEGFQPGGQRGITFGFLPSKLSENLD
jgi:hypothetical protein